MSSWLAALRSSYRSIVGALEDAGRASGYTADADEPDPRYRAYGARAAAKQLVIKAHRRDIAALGDEDRLELARRLIESEWGEQQEVGLFTLDSMAGSFDAGDLPVIDGLVRHLHGWSKIDTAAGGILRSLLLRLPDDMVAMARRWNADSDMWMRRASVVIFTRKVGESGRFTDVALELCDNLVWDREDLVRKGVGWTLKDVMRSDKPRVVEYVKGLRRAGVASVITSYAVRDLPPDERKAVLAVKADR